MWRSPPDPARAWRWIVPATRQRVARRIDGGVDFLDGGGDLTRTTGLRASGWAWLSDLRARSNARYWLPARDWGRPRAVAYIGISKSPREDSREGRRRHKGVCGSRAPGVGRRFGPTRWQTRLPSHRAVGRNRRVAARARGDEAQRRDWNGGPIRVRRLPMDQLPNLDAAPSCSRTTSPRTKRDRENDGS